MDSWSLMRNAGDSHTATVELQAPPATFAVVSWITTTTSTISLNPTTNAHAVTGGTLKLIVTDNNSVGGASVLSVTTMISLNVIALPNSQPVFTSQLSAQSFDNEGGPFELGFDAATD